jgi:hypothetical protein
LLKLKDIKSLEEEEKFNKFSNSIIIELIELNQSTKFFEDCEELVKIFDKCNHNQSNLLSNWFNK